MGPSSGGRTGALLALMTLVPACDRTPDVAERRRVVAAIDAVRDAPRQDSFRRRKLLDDLVGQPATVPEAIRARDACGSTYRLLLDGDDIAFALQSALARGGSPLARSLGGDLREAEDKITRARAAMPECELAGDALRHPPRG